MARVIEPGASVTRSVEGNDRCSGAKTWTGLWATAVMRALLLACVVPACTSNVRPVPAAARPVRDAPSPLVRKGHAVDWWFAFKFNAASFPGCSAAKMCPFGGGVQHYVSGQQFVYATSEDPTLKMRTDCIGETTMDPVGATFDELYNGSPYYVVWNDQFYENPHVAGCRGSCRAPWGHSKGMVAWDDSGRGVVLQVSTPSWPAAGSARHPRIGDGNTLGCVVDDDVKMSQHFFALALTKHDLVLLLRALRNASVVTDPANSQIVRNGGPPDVQELVTALGTPSKSKMPTKSILSNGVILISKPSHLNVPPWQMVSALLGGIPLRTATWWMKPSIPTTTASTPISCWSSTLGDPGPVEIATSGEWEGETLGLKGGPGSGFNHAKIGVSTSGPVRYAIFGDMNQQGALSGNCARSQNGRGGLFYAVKNDTLAEAVAGLIHGDTAPAL
jgi:hypothetical protein